MPRAARIKSYDSIYHIMVKSISDFPLFRDNDDKDKYLYYISNYQEKFEFRVYGYCLMTTHAHLIIDANGADISKIMHVINQCYAQYFNRRHKRHGHLFQDRFKSKIVEDDKYLITLSAYVHNNPLAMKKYRTCPEKYKYSSLAVYLGLKHDPYKIVDEGFVMGMFDKNIKQARENYYRFVFKCDNLKEKAHFEFEDQVGEYRSERTVFIRDFIPEDVIDFVTKYTGVDRKLLHWKYNRKATKAKALCVFLMRYFCDFNYRQICEVLGKLTLSRIAKLSDIGYEMIKNDETYKDIIEDFLIAKAA